EQVANCMCNFSKEGSSLGFHKSLLHRSLYLSPSSNPNGVSGYSGNTRSSLMPGSVELLASFMQDIQNIGNADSEIVKNCEVFDIKVYLKKIILMYWLCILGDKSNGDIV
uniref:Uncharacterized protein n=1 Tax=Buteo japonicus TaxID=224669 RepID=A0A8C0B3D4_9AVES